MDIDNTRRLIQLLIRRKKNIEKVTKIYFHYVDNTIHHGNTFETGGLNRMQEIM